MRLDWKAVLGIAITVFLLWFVLRGVDFAEVWEQVRRGDMLLLGAAVFVATFGFVIRAMRWKVLLTPLKPDTGFRSRFGAVSIGFMANNVLPARIGEFARAYAFSRLEPVSASAAFGTLVVERILDGLVLLGLLLFAISWPTFPGSDVLSDSPMGSALDVIVVALGVLLVALVVFLLRPRPFVRLAERVAALLPGDFARPVVGALEAFLDSLAILKRPWLMIQAVLWSVGFWLFHGVSFWLAMLAFGIRPVDSFVAALFTEAVVGFGVAVPSAPGFLGTFHASAEWALTGVYGVPETQSLAFAFGYHFGGWLPITLIGFWYAWRMGLSLGDVRRSEKRVEAEVEADHPIAAQLLARRPSGEGLPATQNPRPVGRAVEIEAPAKVNLVLRVLERDEHTGYHELETVFQAVDLADLVRIETTRSGMEVQVEGMDLGPPRENLVWKAAAAFAAETALVGGLRVRLTKRIPPGAGLGGGSSDAAATLRGLNALFGGAVPPGRLLELAATLGSDVPFFLAPGPLAVGRGRGERLSPLTPLPKAWVVVVLTGVHVATASAYGALARSRERSGHVAAAPRLSEGWSPESWAEVAGEAVNDFEPIVLPGNPPVARAAETLAGTDPLMVLLAGSGAAVFAVFEDRSAAEAAAEVVRAAPGGAEAHVVPTLDEWPRPRVEGDPGHAPGTVG